jgi:tetratricopeptide (TPR) repeat protein
VLGDLAGARKNYDEALAADRELGNQRAVARDLEGISDLLYDQGNLGEAQKTKEQALAITQAIGAREEQADTLSGLARVLRARGELSEAQPKLKVAIAMQRELGEKSHICGNSFQLAELEIEQGQPAKAETLIREEQDCFGQANPGVLEILARTLLAEGKQAEARAAILRASALINKAERTDTRFTIEITASRVLAASGNRRDAAEAARRLQAIIAQAHRLGFIPYEFEARLALGEVEIKDGSTAAGRAQLAALETEARRQGFELVARQADALASKA